MSEVKWTNEQLNAIKVKSKIKMTRQINMRNLNKKPPYNFLNFNLEP